MTVFLKSKPENKNNDHEEDLIEKENIHNELKEETDVNNNENLLKIT